jgi:hypothetical protein
MARILTKLRIDEVSAVDKGAGDGVKILLMKRASRPDATPADTLRAFPNPNTFNAVLARMAAEEELAKADHDDELLAKADRDDSGDREKNGDRENGDGGGITDHPLAQLATLLVASDKFPDHAQALDHLLNTSHGAALLHRTRKAAKETPPMTSHSEFVRDVVKQYGITALCKSMVQDQKSYGLDESSFTALVVEAAKRDAPAGETEAQSFTRVFSAPTEEGVLLRKAHALAKETTWLDLQPQVISGGDWRDEDDREQAMKQLAEIGRRMAPTATPARQFDLAFSDPKNAALAQRAHRRPAATTFFPMPR